MRKFFALSMVALLALTLAIAAVGCGKKAEETPAATTETPSTMTDTTAMHDSAGGPHAKTTVESEYNPFALMHQDYNPYANREVA